MERGVRVRKKKKGGGKRKEGKEIYIAAKNS